MENYNREIVLPQPDEISTREREDAMGSYLMMFAAWAVGLPLPFLSLIASIIYYYVNKKESKFVGFHAFQSLITQIPISFLNAGVIIWLLVILGSSFRQWESFIVFSIFSGIINLLYVIFSLVAAVKARRGQFFYFFVFGMIAFDKFYGSGADKSAAKTRENLPPKGY
ncbi:MAG: DUF4870 domain-containing protein [Candidatus Aminicenantes bacterium]|nr:DUF4870 domain-containing protein [Candidatus Aminicenantes bacterium]